MKNPAKRLALVLRNVRHFLGGHEVFPVPGAHTRKEATAFGRRKSSLVGIPQVYASNLIYLYIQI